jgi:hypothetical protein
MLGYVSWILRYRVWKRYPSLQIVGYNPLLLTVQSPSLRQNIVRYHVHCPGGTYKIS